jgi:hypothetical protein
MDDGQPGRAYLIDCVAKDETLGPYDRVVAVSGPNLPGAVPPDTSRLVAGLRRRGLSTVARPRWTLSLDEAVDGILDGRWTFYIQWGAYDTVGVHVATSPSGRPYLKTDMDQSTPDELLALPQCR